MAAPNHFIGRRIAAGLGFEANNNPGISVPPSVWIELTDFDFHDVPTFVDNTSALGRIEDSDDQALVKQWATGKMGGNMSDLSIGYLLANMFGTWSTATHPGESTVYDTTFTTLQSNTPPTLTVVKKDAVENKRYALGTLGDIEFSATSGDWAKFTASIWTKIGVAGTDTPAIVAENRWTSKHISVKLGNTLSAITGLGAPTLNSPSTASTGGTLAAGTYYYVITATNANGETIKSNEVSQVTTGSTSTVTVTWAAVTGATGYKIYRGTAAAGENVYYTVGAVTTFTDTGAASTAGTPPTTNTTGNPAISAISFKLKMDRKPAQFIPLGYIDPTAFDTGAWVVTGEVVLRYDAATYHDLTFANTPQALQIQMLNGDKTIGTASNPTLTFTAPRARMNSFAPNFNLDTVIDQTLTFKCNLDLTAGYMLQAVLTNTKATYA